MFKGIDFFSDTVTRPTAAMRRAMAEAEVGDEQLQEDPTTLALEHKVAEALGKKAALFLPSATMANEIALKFHLRPGDGLIAAGNCHLFDAESGGPAVHAQALAQPIYTANGLFTGEDIRRVVVPNRGAHVCVSGALSVENTANMGGGIAWPLNQLREVVETARSLGLKTHLDGARLFNAATRSGVKPAELTAGFDTVTLCLSKGLGCPIGAVLAFDAPHLETFRRHKQLMGGALRQSGILAAAGLYALEHHVSRLEEDHANARRLAMALLKVDSLQLEQAEPSTNMVFFSLRPRLSPDEFQGACEKKGVRFSRVGDNRFRAVTHLDIKSSDVDKAAAVVTEVCAGL